VQDRPQELSDRPPTGSRLACNELDGQRGAFSFEAPNRVFDPLSSPSFAVSVRPTVSLLAQHEAVDTQPWDRVAGVDHQVHRGALTGVHLCLGIESQQARPVEDL